MNEQRIHLNITRQQFEYIIQVLVQRPYIEVLPVITELGKQAAEPQNAEVTPLKAVETPQPQ
jgi:hypothetical protein